MALSVGCSLYLLDQQNRLDFVLKQASYKFTFLFQYPVIRALSNIFTG